MKFIIQFTVSFLLIANTFVFAQREPFSNRVVVSKNGNEMMPFVKGDVVVKEFHNDAFSLSGFPKTHVKVYQEKLKNTASIISSWDKLSPPQGFKAIFYRFIDAQQYSNEFKLQSHDPWEVTVARVEFLL
jgi:hypothetical protein